MTKFSDKMLEDLRTFNEGKELINIKGVAKHYGITPERASSIMIGYSYINGRSHLYLIYDVVDAMCNALVSDSNTTFAEPKTPLKIKRKTEKNKAVQNSEMPIKIKRKSA